MIWPIPKLGIALEQMFRNLGINQIDDIDGLADTEIHRQTRQRIGVRHAHVYVIAAYLIGSILLVPITVLILMTAVIFGPVLGSAYSLVGCLAGAAITYAIGLLLGQGLVQQIAGKKWQRLEKKIGQSGIVAVAALRLLPVAPFTVVNVVSGAFKVPVRDYTIGSVLGLAPGILVTNLFAHQLENAIRNPGPGTIVILAALIVITGLGAVWFKRKFATA